MFSKREFSLFAENVTLSSIPLKFCRVQILMAYEGINLG